MSHYSHLPVFFLVLLGVMALPGVDMAFIIGKTIVGGRESGVAALAGIVFAGWIHVAAAALGVSILLRVYPSAFRILLVLGGCYIAWIGFGLFVNPRALKTAGLGEIQSHHSSTMGQGAITALLNPKAYLFMLAVFPQFLRPEYGPVWLQAIVLAAMISFTQISVYGTLLLVAAQTRQRLVATADTATAINRTVGGILILVALLAVMQGWRAM